MANNPEDVQNVPRWVEVGVCTICIDCSFKHRPHITQIGCVAEREIEIENANKYVGVNNIRNIVNDIQRINWLGQCFDERILGMEVVMGNPFTCKSVRAGR